MFEVNSLTAYHFLTGALTRARNPEEAAYPLKSEDVAAPTYVASPSGAGLGAYLVVALIFGLVVWA